MSKKFANLNAYLLINLVLVSLLIAGLWRGEPLWDSTIRLPNLLVLVVLINAVLIFRESLRKSSIKTPSGRESTFSSLRKVLSGRFAMDECLLQDALTAVFEEAGGEGTILFKHEENGYFNPFASAGAIPAQLSGARLYAAERELRIKHPGSLGEECVCRWEPLLECVPFASNVTHLKLQLIPLRLLGVIKAIWVIIPGKFPLKRPLETSCPLFLESILAILLCRSHLADGGGIDISTGLARYEGFRNAFETEVERSERYQQKMTLMLLTAAGFDEFSPSARDVVQKSIAAGIRDSLRRLDLSFSWEKPGSFAAILTETDSDVSQMVAERIVSASHRHLSGKNFPGGLETKISVGFATYPSDASHGDGLIEKAEEALACAVQKQLGVASYSDIHSPRTEPPSMASSGDNKS